MFVLILPQTDGGIYSEGKFHMQGGIVGTKDVTITWNDNSYSKYPDVK